jgi:hypothetical protein
MSHEYYVVLCCILWVITGVEDVAGIFRIYLPIKAAIYLIMDTFDQAPLIFQMMQDPKSWTLSWGSFSTWGSDRFLCLFCHTGSQYNVYDYIGPLAPPDYQRYMTNNCWCSVDAHFQDVVGRFSLLVFVIMAANISLIACHVPMPQFYNQQ